MSYSSYIAHLLVVIQVLGVIAAVHAVFTVRTAQGAIAWATSLVFMPLLTLLPYLVFGRGRFDAYIGARRQANAEMHTAAAELDWRPWVEEALAARQYHSYKALRALAELARMPTLANNQVRLLINGQASFEAIFEAIAEAQRVLLVQFFIIRDDALGQRLAQLLLERAANGVEVFLLYDAIGSHGLPGRYVEHLRAGGVQVQAFSTGRGTLNRFQLNFRNHRKIVVADGVRGFVGGHNVGVEYLGEKPPLAPWRDTHVELRGPAVACLQECFAEDWFWATRALPTLLLPSAYASEGMLCQVVASGPADKQETCSLFFVEAINSATERIWITTPYFIPDEAVSAALRLAVLRGVDVRILLPSRPDHRTVYAASSLYAQDAVRVGVRVFRYQPGFLHQKVVLVDRDSAAVGSANLDNRSFRLNFEIMLVTVDEGFAAEVESMLLADFDNAVEMGPEHSSRLQQLGMRVARLVSPIL
ncbi:cardiolipin synthase [Pseudomonas panipatensis]|jgi:cardiolipin synthase|uniref:Cardiolipin synthase n=1 Tax=Pseudomonas panipatensis TaxID=428992 RepID=A0A1G8MZ83_9PSED|nr:cardiolipin synthase [Pseudomonas panipatensis]SDI73176.1 cardiolipin synthase [Pseudomonas panipatensis]SMP78519.1 cardiolipin synthase [Pseudomonas panipatensis]